MVIISAKSALHKNGKVRKGIQVRNITTKTGKTRVMYLSAPAKKAKPKGKPKAKPKKPRKKAVKVAIAQEVAEVEPEE